MSQDKITIYLAELAHNGFGLSLRTCPLGVGVIAAYCKKIHGEAVAIRLFRQIEDLIQACKEKKPQVVGFGYFSWNDYLTLVATKVVRDLAPETVIALGGSNLDFYIHELKTRVFPKGFDKEGGTVRDDCQLLQDYPHIDLLIHGDGEVPFANIISAYLECRDRRKLKEKKLDGCSALVEGEIIQGQAAPLLYDLDQVPSPYVMGLFTEFFERFKLLPQIETLRGCPFKCTFCTIGLQSGKLRRHSLEYTKAEIHYLKQHSPNRILRIADPNWGIVKHDVELAEYIRELYDTEGYPNSMRVYYSASGPFENVKQMAATLRPLLPLNMSFQSLTKEVLKNITRSNMALEKVQEMVRFAHDNRIATSTELISGLPGETVESFRQSFLKAIELRIDSIYTGHLYLIKGSELYSYEARQKYGFKTACSLIGKDVTKVDGKYTFEMDEMVVENNSIRRDDFWNLHRFRLLGHISYGAAYWKEIIMHGLNYEITPLQLYDELLGHPEQYPFINSVTSKYVEAIQNLYFDSPQALEQALAQHIEKYNNVEVFNVSNHFFRSVGKVQGLQEKGKMIAEVGKALASLYAQKRNGEGCDDFYSILDLLAQVQRELIITPLEDLAEEISFDCDYDLLAWAGEGYRQPLAEYRLIHPKRFKFVVRNMKEHLDFIERTRGLDEIEKYDFYFKTMVSSNMRRYIAYADENQRRQKYYFKDPIAPMTT